MVTVVYPTRSLTICHGDLKARTKNAIAARRVSRSVECDDKQDNALVPKGELTGSERAEGIIADQECMVGCNLSPGDGGAVYRGLEEERDGRKEMEIQRMTAVRMMLEPHHREACGRR